MGRVVSLAVSRKKGTPKTPVDQVVLVPDHGIEGDAHAGPWHRQVSLLRVEALAAAQQRGILADFGDFAENLAVSGLDEKGLAVGTLLDVGPTARLCVTQVGKKCHARCAVYHRAGDCIMPKEGVFARVLSGGTVKVGDVVRIVARGQGPPGGGNAAAV
ncbi:MAG: MOSC domain-containing protein [Deltaproteobacteria bacterium]|nr:MOSC domain-containing protein [Deltaproteobacteria bacterium]